MRDGGCAARVASGASASRISYPASRLRHHAYAASAVTNPLTAAAASRCPYSIIVGRSSGGSSLPRQNGHGSPPPPPPPGIRAMAPRGTSREVERTAAPAGRGKRRRLGGGKEGRRVSAA